MRFKENADILSENIKNNINELSCEDISNEIRNLKPFLMPNPKELTVSEYNWLVDYIIEARGLVKLTDKKPEKLK
jgi:hypothetical protein